MAKHYFKNNPNRQVFYDSESGLHIVGATPVVFESYKPGIHKKIDEAVREGGIISLTKAEYEANLKSTEDEEVDVKEKGEPVDDDDDDDDNVIPNPLEGKTKEEMLTWAEEQTYVSEDQLNEAKKIKKKDELFDFLTEIWLEAPED